MKYEPEVRGVRVLIEVIGAVGVEQRRAALDAVYLVALFQKQFRQLGAVLAGDTCTCNQSFTGHVQTLDFRLSMWRVDG